MSLLMKALEKAAKDREDAAPAGAAAPLGASEAPESLNSMDRRIASAEAENWVPGSRVIEAGL